MTSPPSALISAGDDPALTAADIAHLRQAIWLSAEARAAGRHPFAALVVAADGMVLAEACNNSMPPQGDPTQHAELRAAQGAFRAGTAAQLAGATLYTSAEPCAMCAGAIYWCGIDRVVYGLSESRLLQLTGSHPAGHQLVYALRSALTNGFRGNASTGR